MHALRIIASCAVAGTHLDPGTTLVVPDQIAAHDAESLLRMGRAVAVAAAPATATATMPARKTPTRTPRATGAQGVDPA